MKDNLSLRQKIEYILKELRRLRGASNTSSFSGSYNDLTDKPKYYRVSVTPTGTVQHLTPLTIGAGMPVTINDNGLFSANRFTNTTNKPLLVNIDCGLSFGTSTWVESTCTMNMLKNGSTFKIPSVTTKDSNNFISVRLTTSELLLPGEYISFTINQNSGSGKTLLQDFQNFFNIIALEV